MSIDTNALNSLGLADKPPNIQKKNELGQDMFMKLMVAQLNNQNPLKPLEGAEFLSQLAQFSTVTGIQDLQASFSSFAASMNEEQALQAANLVGKTALIPSSQGVLGETTSIKGEVTAPAGASNVTVRIFGTNGAQVPAVIDLQQTALGQASFVWDGKLAGDGRASPGTYQIKAEAVVEGKTTALDPLVSTPVESVTLGGVKGIEADFGALGRYALKDIREISVNSEV